MIDGREWSHCNSKGVQLTRWAETTSALYKASLQANFCVVLLLFFDLCRPAVPYNKSVKMLTRLCQHRLAACGHVSSPNVWLEPSWLGVYIFGGKLAQSYHHPNCYFTRLTVYLRRVAYIMTSVKCITLHIFSSVFDIVIHWTID